MATPDIWEHGFEDQTYGRLTNNINQTATAGDILSDEAARGTFALRLNIPLTPTTDGSGGALNYGFHLHPPKPSEYWSRFALMFAPSLPTSTVKIHRFRGTGGSAPCGSVVFGVGASKKLSWFWDDFAGGQFGTNFGPTLVPGTWYWLEVHYQFLGKAAKMHVEVYLDDVLLVDEDSVTANNGNTGMFLHFYNGTVNRGNTVATKLWIDGIGLSSTQMGTPIMPKTTTLVTELEKPAYDARVRSGANGELVTQLQEAKPFPRLSISLSVDRFKAIVAGELLGLIPPQREVLRILLQGDEVDFNNAEIKTTLEGIFTDPGIRTALAAAASKDDLPTLNEVREAVRQIPKALVNQ